MVILSRLRGQAAFVGGAVARKITTEYAVDGPLLVRDGQHELSKAGVGAYTLPTPTSADEGAVLFITSSTANAHVVTATGLINNGVAGGSKNTLTFAAFAGAGAILIVTNLKYHVMALVGVTVA